MTMRRRQALKGGRRCALAGIVGRTGEHAGPRRALETAVVDGLGPTATFTSSMPDASPDEVRKATGGGGSISTLSRAAQLGFKGPEHLRAVARRPWCRWPISSTSSRSATKPLMGIEGIPFLAGSPDELKVLQKHLRPEYERIAVKNNQNDPLQSCHGRTNTCTSG